MVGAGSRGHVAARGGPPGEIRRATIRRWLRLSQCPNRPSSSRRRGLFTSAGAGSSSCAIPASCGPALRAGRDAAARLDREPPTSTGRRVYGDLIAAGYRVLAIDHRGHGRGLRPLVPFRLDDCAADAAGVLRTLGLAPALIVGYSMGGAIAQLVARDHPDVVAGLVLSGTAQHWREPELRRTWKLMGAVGFGLAGGARPGLALRVRAGRSRRVAAMRTWMRSEMLRHSARASPRPAASWGASTRGPGWDRCRCPTAVVVTSRDDAVPPAKQLALAAALHAPVFDAPIRHLAGHDGAGGLQPGAVARPWTRPWRVPPTSGSGRLRRVSRRNRILLLAVGRAGRAVRLRAVGSGGDARRRGDLRPDRTTSRSPTRCSS